jgi:mRNA interferase HigB
MAATPQRQHTAKLCLIMSEINVIAQLNFPIPGTLTTFDKTQRLRVIAKKVLRDFWEVHPDSEQPLKAWYQEAAKAEWTTPNEIKTAYPSASFLAGNRVVFNIKGNHYRLIVKINYDYAMIWIRFIGTHAAYDKIDAKTI